jgi:hypothetical protein
MFTSRKPTITVAFLGGLTLLLYLLMASFDSGTLVSGILKGAAILVAAYLIGFLVGLVRHGRNPVEQD